MSSRDLEKLFSNWKFESFLQAFVDTKTSKNNDIESNNLLFLNLISLLNGGYYTAFLAELDYYLTLRHNLSSENHFKILFMKCDVFNYLGEDKKGISTINEINNMIIEYQRNLENLDFLLFKNGLYSLLFSPYDQSFNRYTENSEYFLSFSIKNDLIKDYLPEYYLIMGIVLRKRQDITLSKVYLKKSLDLSPNNKFLMGQVHVQLGMTNLSGQIYNEAIVEFGKSIQISKELNNSNRILESKIYLSNAYLRSGELNLAEDLLLETIQVNKPLFEDFFSILLYEQLGDVYFFKGSLKSAFYNCYFIAEKKYYKLNYYKFGLIKNLNNLFIKIARLKASEGNFEDSKAYINRAIQNYADTNDLVNENIVKSYLGNAYFEMGDYNSAFNVWTMVDIFFQKLNNKRVRAFNNLNIGKFYLISNNAEAITYYKNTIQNFEELNLVEGIIESYVGYSIALEEYEPEMPDLERSIFYKTMDKIANLKGNYLFILEGIYRLCLISIENSLGKSRAYIDLTLKLLEQAPQNNRTIQKIKFLQAVKYKSIIRLREQTKSLELFEEIIKEELMDYQTTLLSYLNLLELKIFELKFSGDLQLQILKEADAILEKLVNLTSINKFSAWYAKVLALKSQLNLLEMKFDNAERNINDALIIAKNKNMERLLKILSIQYDDLLSKMTKLKSLDFDDDSISKRLNITDFLVFEKNKSNELKIPEEEPGYISIIDSAGISLYSYNFLTNQSENFDQLISGFLIAINSVILRLFSSSGFIERIKHKEFTIMIIHLTDNLYFCYAFKGPSYYAQKKLDSIKLELNQQQFVISSVVNASTKKRTLNKSEFTIIESFFRKYFINLI